MLHWLLQNKCKDRSIAKRYCHNLSEMRSCRKLQHSFSASKNNCLRTLAKQTTNAQRYLGESSIALPGSI